MFIKTGDGKIETVLDEENLTEAQKKAVKDANAKTVKQSNDESDSAGRQN